MSESCSAALYQAAVNYVYQLPTNSHLLLSVKLSRKSEEDILASASFADRQTKTARV